MKDYVYLLWFIPILAATIDMVTASVSFGSPGNSAVGDAAADGTAVTAARSDHLHGREGAGTPVTQAFSDTASAGTATTVARSNHRHGMPAAPSLTSRIRSERGGGAQNISAASWTVIQHNTEIYDNLGEYDPTTNYRFTAQAAGLYVLIAISQLQSMAANTYMAHRVRKNGTAYGTESLTYLGNVSDNLYDIMAMDLELVANDYLDIQVLNGDTVARNLANQSFIVVHRAQ